MKSDPLTILLIEDQKFCVDLIKGAFKQHNIIAAYNGQEGIEAYCKSKPHIVLLDIMLPDLSGFDVLSRLREQDDSAYVLMLSGMNNDLYIRKCRELGASGFLGKPYQKEHIDYYIQHYRQTYAV